MTTYNLHLLQYNEPKLHETRLEHLLSRLTELGAKIVNLVFRHTKNGAELILEIDKDSLRNTAAHNIGCNYGFVTHTS